MTVPCIVLKTLGGVTLNPVSAEYTSALAPVQMRVQTAPRDIQVTRRSGTGPSYQGQTLGERTLSVRHAIAGDGTTHEANLRLLKQHHYSTLFGSRTLVFTDTDSADKRVTVVAARLLPLATVEQGWVDAEWTLLDPIAYDDAASSVAAVAKSSSPATLAVTNAGNESSRQAVVTLRPSAQKTVANGQRYRIRVTPINRNPRPLQAWPVDLADKVGGAGWNHAAEVTGGRSRSDGADVEVYVNGRRTDRWAWASGSGTWNQNATRIWANLDLAPARIWTFRSATTLGAGDTTVPVKDDLVNMPREPFYAAFVNTAGTTVEVVRVTAFDDDARTLTVVRGQRGTSATTWADSSKLYWCPVLIDVLYGWTSATSPTYVDDARKPMVLQSVPGTLSSNAAWTFNEFMESTESGLIRSRKGRTGAWRPRLVSPEFGRDDMFWNYIPRTASRTSDAAVATLMALAYRSAGALGGHPLSDCWDLVSPIGITQVVHTYDVTTLDFDAGLEANFVCSVVDADGNEEELANHDATSGTETLTPSANAYAVRYKVDPFDPKVDSNTVELTAQEPTDADGWTVDSVSVTFDTDEKVLLVWGTYGNAYQIGRPGAPATLADASGRTLEVYGPILDVGETLSVDCDAGTLTLSGDGTGTGQLAAGAFLRLPPGTNNLTFTEAGLSGGATVEFGVSSKRGAWL